MTKTVADSNDADTLASQGEVLTYSFSVTNTGNVPLTNVKITDAMIPALANGAVCAATLAVGATTTCPGMAPATHVVTAAEVAAGKVLNTATTTGTPPSGANVTAQATAKITSYAPPVVTPPGDTVTPAPSISLTKAVADSDDADSLASQDETLTYSFSVTNTGNVALTNVTLTDAMIPALANGALCVADLAVGATTTCPALPAATHLVSAADAAHGTVDNTATVTGTSPAGTHVSDQDSATITTVAPVVTPDPTPAPAPFTWDWTYADPSCSALTVVYPSNIPDGQANDVNVRILTHKGEVTLNFHNNEGFWGGTTLFDFLSHPKWPAGVTSYSVVWTQVGGTNYHWQGNVKCLIKDDGNPATADAPVGVTTVSGWRSSTVTVRKGQTVSADTVSVSQAGDQDLVLQVLRAGSARGASTWQDVKTVATDGDTAKVTFGRQLRKGTFKYRLVVAGSDTVTGAATKSFTVKVK
nr:hypothetical protein [Nocardioides luti]